MIAVLLVLGLRGSAEVAPARPNIPCGETPAGSACGLLEHTKPLRGPPTASSIG